MSEELERFAVFYRKQVKHLSLPGVDVRRVWLQIRSRLQKRRGSGDPGRKGS